MSTKVHEILINYITSADESAFKDSKRRTKETQQKRPNSEKNEGNVSNKFE